MRMPFGISSASEEYQHRQHKALQGLRGVTSMADNTQVFGSGDTEKEAIIDHDRNLVALLRRARGTNLKLKGLCHKRLG